MESEVRVLFVDDEKKFADAMARVLKIRGFNVQTAYSGKVALEVFKPGGFDLVITDLSMPGMDGIELIREIRKRNPYQRIIVVTGFPSQHSQQQAYTLGTLNYIAKPFKTNRFLELVDEALKSSENGLLGTVRLSPSDLVQLYSFMGKTIMIEILNETDGEIGRIYFLRGQVIHAETPKASGKDAFYEIQSWDKGIFKTDSPVKDVIQTIDESVDALLLEAARRLDENPK
ncbi:response regulator [candidate division WOR-3 bacterium]|uniref:Response regulator n=1 Tax=candidate division WOR-3 bacterium TaxID=2052148 RepID=A0A9D5K8J2_UNCW3|nr:response regulator [candidate division WOR-3 bacterium]MBD3364312.1 response regulator [candidate division WOR-3 bacterium]